MEPNFRIIKIRLGRHKPKKFSYTKYMSENQKWIIQDAEGKIWGPFAYEKLLRQIENSFYNGEELVATFPGGAWTKMS